MPAYNSLAILLRTGNALDEALDVCELALSVCPDHPELLNTQAVVLYTLGQIAEAEASVRRSIALRPDYWTAWDNLLLFSLYRDDLSNAEIDSLHGEWASRLEASVHRESLSDRIDGFVPHGGRRLRVAFLSADFRFHPVARFVEPIFRALDRSRVEVYAYASNEDVDEVTAHLKDLVENWRDVARQSDRQLLERIRKDRIDVLFDLSGHTAGNRLGVLARRAAPTQISYLGYAHRTGLAAIDFRLVDSITDPAKHESGRGEAPIRIDGCFLCYAPAVDAGQLPTHSRSHVADRAGGIRFGSFNHLAKLSPMVLTLWAEILRKTPGSVLLIKSRGGESRRFRQRIRKVWRNAGLADERLQLIEHDPGYVEHLQRYRTIDIALDTYPYNGTTTTCDALWMGVPVITLAGARHASRVGASLLSACGHPELIAHSPVEYVNKAVGLAGDSRRLSALNAVLRGDIESSPVMDSAAFGRSFVTALERAVLMPHSSSLESVG